MIYQLGQKVTVHTKLKRSSKWIKESDLSPLKYEFKFWEETKLRAPIDGIVIGIRNLSNGNNDYIQDYGNCYTAKEHFKAIIVAYNISRKPILVKL